MSKELPYFKFMPGEWLRGDITLCPPESQGIFINLCCYYWMKDCSISLANAKQRFSKDVASLDELLKMEIISLDENENIIIKFLDEQMSEFVDVSEKRAVAGKLGGLAKAKQLLSKPVAKRSNIEKDIDIEKDKIKNKEQIFKNEVYSFNHYDKEMQDDFIRYWTEPNKSKTKMKWEIEKTWDTKLRLITWEKRSNKFNNKKNGNTTNAEINKLFND